LCISFCFYKSTSTSRASRNEIQRNGICERLDYKSVIFPSALPLSIDRLVSGNALLDERPQPVRSFAQSRVLIIESVTTSEFSFCNLLHVKIGLRFR